MTFGPRTHTATDAQLLSPMRQEFGGHVERPTGG